MTTTPNHNINIVDNNANWLNWGTLVQDWVYMRQALPQNVGQLKAQMDGRGIQYVIDPKKSPDTRGVTFIVYPVKPGDPITIPLPDKSMVDADTKYLTSLTNNGTKPSPYPLQAFYSVCFGGAAEVPLSLQEILNMEARRIGEYVINECM
jgi:hypothetical protein